MSYWPKAISSYGWPTPSFTRLKLHLVVAREEENERGHPSTHPRISLQSCGYFKGPMVTLFLKTGFENAILKGRFTKHIRGVVTCHHVLVVEMKRVLVAFR